MAVQDNGHISHLPWWSPFAPAAGYIKLITPIVQNESNMFSIRIFGYGYGYGPGDPFEIRCGGYAYGAGTLINTDCHTEGTDLPVEIDKETRGASTVVVIRIGTPTSTWYYPHFTAEYVGWVGKNAADFVWVAGETTPSQLGNTNKVFVNDGAGTITTTGNHTNGAITDLVYLKSTHIGSAGAIGEGTGLVFASNNSARVSKIAGVGDGTGTNNEQGLAFFTQAVAGSLTERLRISHNGNVGIGTISPQQVLHVYSAADSYTGHYTSSTGQAITDGFIVGITGLNAAAWNKEAGYLSFATSNTERIRIDSSGNVGVGTTFPIAKLHVAGSAKVDANLTVDGNIAAKYQDLAEWTPSSETLTPGTLVVLDQDRINHVKASVRPYDTKVAGVVSDQPGLLLGEPGEGKAKVATTGRVKLKVDASKAPIEVGDLLVTSDKPGFAMKSIPIAVGETEFHRPGTIVGKALQPLASGVGEILVLLTLQ